jgi:hypothetical protein
MFDNNNFVMDNVSTRIARFRGLSGRIDDFATALNLPANLLAWAQNAQNEFAVVKTDRLYKRNDLYSAKYDLAVADKNLLKSYQTCKNLLISQFDNDEKMSLLGISGATPQEHNNLAAAADILLKGVADLQLQGFTDCLPEQFRLELEQNLADSIDKFYKIGSMEEKLAKSKRTFQERFEQDNKNLRIMYNLIIAYFGKECFDLPALGFSIDNKKRGRKRNRKPAEPENEG